MAIATVINPGDEDFRSPFTCTWNGQKLTGTVNVPAKGKQGIELSFKPPSTEGLFRADAPLRLSFGNKIAFERHLQMSQNIGLSKWIPLRSSTPPVDGQVVQFRADADNQALFFSYDIEGIELKNLEGLDSLIMDLSIDARPYGKRLSSGAIRNLVIRFPSADDGPGKVDKIQIGTFGSGYTSLLDSKGVTAELGTRPNGNRRITIAIPSKYFYRHEYGRVPDQSIGNGNSQFGFNTTVNILDTSAEHGGPGYTDRRRFSHTQPISNNRDAESLSILELATPGTGRWSARLF